MLRRPVSSDALKASLPAFFLATGLFGALLFCLFNAFQPKFFVLVIAATVVVITFFIGRFFLCGMALGLLAIGLNAPTPYPEAFDNCEFSAQITRPNYSKRLLGQEIRLFTEPIVCGKQTLPAQTIQYWDNSRTFLSYTGKRLTVRANLIPVHTRLNPFGFDYERYLLSEGVRLSAKKLQIIDTHAETNVLLLTKQYLAQTLFDNLSPNNSGIMLALLTGNRTALSPEQKATMQATGTSHLLAISGLHLALIGGLTWLVFQWLWALSWRLSDRLSPRHAGAIVALVAITFYAILTGFDIPVKRAWIMFSLLIVSWLLGRGISNSSLILAAGAVMFVSPYAAVSVGFYFSFVATFIVLWSVKLPYSPLARVCIMQLLINLTLLPITWGVFGVVPLSALWVNLAVIPWLGLWVLPWAVLASIISVFSEILSAPIWTLLDTTTSMLWHIIEIAERLHCTLTPDFRPSLVSIIIAVLAIIIALVTTKKWCFSAFLLLFIPLSPSLSPEILIADRIYTSALIHNGKEAILINPGRRYRYINQGKMWQRYLQQHNLQLKAIVLENDKLTRISSTQWLLDNFPNAKVMTLGSFPLPYKATYCQSIKLEGIILNAEKKENHCQVNVQWMGRKIALLAENENENDNNINPKATLFWQGKTYEAKLLGATTVTLKNDLITIKGRRQSKRLWR